jgi:hypothetical protein
MNRRNCPCPICLIEIPRPSEPLTVSAGTFYSTSLSQIPYNAPVPVASGFRIAGSGISLISATDILLDDIGVYLVSYYIQGDPIGDIETIACSLRLNSVIVPGSVVQSVTTTLSYSVEPSVSNTCIIEVTTPQSVLQLFNSSNSGLTHVVWVENFCSASITVVRLS